MVFRASASVLLAVIVAACGGAGPTSAPASTAPASTAPAITSTPPASPAPATPSATPSQDAAPSTAAPSPNGSAAPALNGLRVTLPSGELTLGGMLWKPAGNGPFPAVLWNHGSELGPGLAGSNPLLGPVFADRGYVFFMPMRRGQGTSEGTWIVDATNAVPAAQRPALIARLHTTEQLADQLAGLAFLKALPYVDVARIAVAGWSYGGIQTVLGAGSPEAGYVGAVAFTPGSQAWDGNADLQDAMLDAATSATIPFLFIQAQNDFNLVPTQQLTDAILDDGGAATRTIYPAFGSTEQDGHEFAVRGSDIWSDEVFDFLEAALGAEAMAVSVAS